MMFLILVATPLFTYGTALIESGAEDRGESALEALFSTSITQEMRNRILYNLGVASLNKSLWNDALSYFQQINGESGDLKPFVNEGIESALKNKHEETLPPFSPLPTPISLTRAANEVKLLLEHITSLPFEEGENFPEYSALKTRLDLLLKRRTEWWGSVIEKQEELAPKGCFQQHWESVVQRLGEGTEMLEKAAQGFANKAKPYAVLYPLLKEALNRLQLVEKGVATEQKGGGQQPEQTERFQTLSEMFRKDVNAPKTIPKGALW